ncbi:MAG: hypothetical protein WC529_01685 [Candidatus Margulisiibacteriota bacterium]
MPPIRSIERRSPTDIRRTRTVLRDVLTQFRNFLSLSRPNTLELRLLSSIDLLSRKLLENKPIVRLEVERFELLLKEYREKRKPAGLEKELIARLETGLAELKETRIFDQGAATRPLVATDPLRANHSITVIDRARPAERERFSLESTLSLSRLTQRDRTGRFDPRAILRLLTGLFRLETRSRFSAFVLRLSSRLLIERLSREIVRQSERSGQVTREELENAVKEINRQLKETERVRERAVPISRELAYDREQNTVRVMIRGEAAKEELREIVSELVRADAGATVPLLAPTIAEIKTAAATAPARGETKIESVAHNELVKFVAEAVATPGIPERQLVDALTSLIKGPEQAYEPLSLEPAPAAPAEPTAPAAPAAPTTRPTAAKTPAREIQEASQEIAQAVLQQQPEAALPALIRVHAQQMSAGNEAAVKTVEQAILEFARSETGQKAVVLAFANAKEQPLTVTAIGQKAIVQAVRQIAAAAPAPVAPTVKLERALDNIRAIAAANPARLSPETLSLETAKAVIGLAVKLERSSEVVKNLDNVKATKRAKAAEARQRVAPVNRQTGIVNSLAKRAANRHPAIQARFAAAQKSLRAVMAAADHGGFILPKSIVESIYSGLAGIRLVPSLPGPQRPQTPAQLAESRAASSLRNVVQALEAQAARGVSARDPIAWSKVFTLSAQVMMYGIIMRLVRGRMDQVDKVIELLKQKKELAKIVAKIKKGEIDTATDDLYEAVLATASLPELLAA